MLHLYFFFSTHLNTVDLVHWLKLFPELPMLRRAGGEARLNCGTGEERKARLAAASTLLPKTLTHENYSHKINTIISAFLSKHFFGPRRKMWQLMR